MVMSCCWLLKNTVQVWENYLSWSQTFTSGSYVKSKNDNLVTIIKLFYLKDLRMTVNNMKRFLPVSCEPDA